jgi:hypothetical protein
MAFMAPVGHSGRRLPWATGEDRELEREVSGAHGGRIVVARGWLLVMKRESRYHGRVIDWWNGMVGVSRVMTRCN